MLFTAPPEFSAWLIGRRCRDSSVRHFTRRLVRTNATRRPSHAVIFVLFPSVRFGFHSVACYAVNATRTPVVESDLNVTRTGSNQTIHDELQPAAAEDRRHGVAKSRQPHVQDDAGRPAKSVREMWWGRRHLHSSWPVHAGKQGIRFRQVRKPPFAPRRRTYALPKMICKNDYDVIYWARYKIKCCP